MNIPDKIYAEIVQNVPILCVDLLMKDESGSYLLLKRKNEPLKNEYYLPGGRIFIGESLEDAARRKAKEETGVRVKGPLLLVGIYEDVFTLSSFGAHTYHTLSMVFSCSVEGRSEILLNNYSDAWKFSETLPKRFQEKVKWFKNE